MQADAQNIAVLGGEMTATKDRPILFRGEMVRAILDGRKTQTRRAIKPQPERRDGYDGWHWKDCCWCDPDDEIYSLLPKWCPYGVPGDLLWVRETWACIWTEHEPGEGQTAWDVPHRIEYKADSGAKYPGEWPDDCGDDEECPRWSPSIHMPRRASRIMLEVVSVRVERVQEISEKDIDAEGTWFPGTRPENGDPRLGFEMLWNMINENRGFGWDVDPWAWVIEFKRVEGGE